MSNAITNACRPVQMPPTPKNILMAIADRADHKGVAWPSIPGLCEATCYGRTAVIEAVKWLEQDGFVSIERVTGRNNCCTIDLDRIGKAPLPTRRDEGTTRPAGEPVRQADPSGKRTRPAGEPVRQADPTRPAPAPPPVRQADSPVRQTDPNHQEPSDNHQSTTKRAKRVRSAAVEPEHFASFWAAYPSNRRIGKQDALKAFMKLGVDEALLAKMLEAIGRQAQSEQWRKSGGQYIPHPATWLNGRRWEDGDQAIGADEVRPAWATRAGFLNRYEAENAGCYERNATAFSGGQPIGQAAGKFEAQVAL